MNGGREGPRGDGVVPRNAGDDLGIPGYAGASPIGHGGFGLVFKASQLAFDREVAVKVLASPLRDESVKKRFERECRAIGALSGHPHIVTVYESGIDSLGRPFIAMDFMPGGSFADFVARNGALPWQEVAAMGVKLSGAVATAHRAGILHRDIKPENILLSGYGEPKLADFGISTVPGAYQTHSGVITASLTHAAPEILSAQPATELSDVYSLASTLFFLLRGTPPFSLGEDESLPSLIARILTHPVPDLRRSGIPRTLCAELERALAKEPSQRHASAEDLAHALQEVQRAAGLVVTELPLAGEQVWVGPASPAAGPGLTPAPAQPAASLAGQTRHRRRHELAASGPAPRRRRRIRGPLLATGLALALATGGVFVTRDLMGGTDRIQTAAARRPPPASSSPSHAPERPRATPRPERKKEPERRKKPRDRKPHADRKGKSGARVQAGTTGTRSSGANAGAVAGSPTGGGPIDPPSPPKPSGPPPPPPTPTFVPPPPSSQPKPQKPLPSTMPGLPAG